MSMISSLNRWQKVFVLTLFLALGLYAPVGMASGKADTLFTNGNIHTGDANFSKASHMVVKGQKLLYVGNDLAAARQLTDAATRVVDLKGKTVLPGLIDGHMHLLYEGQRLTELPITDRSKEDIIAMVKEEAARLAPGEWIVGNGWNNENWTDKAWPTRHELDAVSPNNPVYLGRVDRHAGWVNSATLAQAGIDKTTPDPQGGAILKDASGEVLGILVDTAKSFAKSKMPEQSPERSKEALLAAQKGLFAYGITSIADAGQLVQVQRLMRELYQNGTLKLRVYSMLDTSKDQDLAFLAAGSKAETGLYGERFTMRAVKVMSDGALGSRGAWLREDYADQPGHKGAGRYTDDELYAIVRRARDNGLQVATHAIGDAAVQQCLDVMERVLKESPLADHRYRVEHFQITRPEDVDQAVKNGIIPAMQAVHATSDWKMTDSRVGAGLGKTSYAWRDVIKAGGLVINGSDAPVESANPWHGLYASVSRIDREGNPAGGWNPEQKMTREEALRSFTLWPARGQFEEAIKGSLESGKLADFVVIDRDIMTCPASDILTTRVLMTVLGGETVYTQAH